MRAFLVSLLALAGLVVAPHAVLAQSKYFDLHIGYNYVIDGDWDAAGSVASVHYDSQPAFGGSFGYMAGNGFRIEAELTYRVNDIESVDGTLAAGKLNTLSLMVNALYELRFGDSGGLYGSASPLRPYFGLGVGGVRASLEDVAEVLGVTLIDDSANGFAYQFIGGLGVELTPTTLITVDYRYLIADNLEMSTVGGTAFEIDSANATIMVGLRTNF